MKFNVLTSTCAPLNMENVDTDQIIPARFLKSTSRDGFGENLFRDWRYDADNQPIPSFVLNDDRYKDAKVLVAGKNFGCGSSREHAAWAIADYGFRAVISTFFADIHKNNELNSFVLPVVVSPEFLAELFAEIGKNPANTVTIDLPAQTITINSTGRSEHFDINSYKKQCLMEGQDDIEYLLSHRDEIIKFEESR